MTSGGSLFPHEAKLLHGARRYRSDQRCARRLCVNWLAVSAKSRSESRLIVTACLANVGFVAGGSSGCRG
jgi:hypothetical protein